MLFMISASLAQLIAVEGCAAFNFPKTSCQDALISKKIRYKWHLMHIVLLYIYIIIRYVLDMSN